MFWLLMAAALSFQQGNRSIFIDRVAVKVNDKIITERELINAYRQRRSNVLQSFTGAELDRKLKEAWESTVRDAEDVLLLYEKSVELGISFSEDEVRSRLMAVKESNGMSDEEFEQAILEQTGTTFDEFIDARKREESAQNVINSQIIAKIKIEDSEVAKYYDEHLDEFMRPETYRIAEILFLKGDAPDAALEQKIQACRQFLAEGGDFGEAAQKFSDSGSRDNGGDLGEVQFGDLIGTIEDRVRQMEPGQVSELLETPTSYYIIKLLNRTPERPKPLEEVQPEILQRLRNPRLTARIDEYISELKNQYLLHTYLNEMPWYLEL